MTVKYAFRNLIRSPWRTIIYILTAVLVTLSITASLFVYTAASKAKTEIENNYMFIASLVPKGSVALRDMKYCIHGTDVIAYNVSMSEEDCMILGGSGLYHLPENKQLYPSFGSKIWLESVVYETHATEEEYVLFGGHHIRYIPENNFAYQNGAEMIWMDELLCRVIAVENLALTYPFFTGECTITQGTGITKEGYLGHKTEMVIPWWLAEEYDIQIGDQIVRRYDAQKNMLNLYLKAEVVGIYETSVRLPDHEEYPVYMPLSIAEFDYAETIGKSYGTLLQEVYIDRADFILPSRESFEPFVLQAKENGLNFSNADLIFNNRPYDVLLSELNDINMIALVVAVTVLAAGLGMLIFFTVYLCHTRKNERILLFSLGMKKEKIVAIMMTEIAVMLILSVGIGFFAGRYAAGTVCDYVETTVSEKSELSESIQMSGKAKILENIDPLEREHALKISISKVSFEKPAMEIFEIVKPDEGEAGIAIHTYYNLGNRLDALKDKEANDYADRVPTRVIGLTDMEAAGIKLRKEEVSPAHQQSWEGCISIYVSESYDRSDFEKLLERELLYFSPWDNGEMVKLCAYYRGLKFTRGVIVGTYEENEYFSGTDILVSMEDYQKLYQEFSVTNEDFYFERMEIFDK